MTRKSVPRPRCAKKEVQVKAHPFGQELQVEVITLSSEDQVMFVEAVLNPPPLVPAMERAFKRRAELGLDDLWATADAGQKTQSVMSLEEMDAAKGTR